LKENLTNDSIPNSEFLSEGRTVVRISVFSVGIEHWEIEH